MLVRSHMHTLGKHVMTAATCGISGQVLYSVSPLLHWPALFLQQSQEYVYNSF